LLSFAAHDLVYLMRVVARADPFGSGGNGNGNGRVVPLGALGISFGTYIMNR
jgi:hypothetical protein